MDPHQGLTENERRAVEDFRRRHRTGVLSLLFTDVVGSTEIKRRLGDAAGTERIERRQSLVRKVLSTFSEAEEISTAGDSFFAVFVKPSDAVRFALQLQHDVRLEDRETDTLVELRVGIHMGEVFIREKGEGALERDVLGVQVDTAARVMSLAGGRQILLTRSVFDNARTILRGETLPGIEQLSWINHGPYLLKGLEDTLEICEVGELEKARLRAPSDTDAGKRATVAGAEPVLGWRPALEQTVPGTEWELERLLGEGGFGEVWLGRHRHTKDRRVFKFCFRADQLRNFKRELTLFRLLKEVLGERPDIARLYNVQFEEAPYYLELEHTPGGDLADWIDSRGGFANVTTEQRLAIVAQIATALAAAHSVGVLHKDVKPSNTLVEERPDGSVQVRLTDFGIGQVTDRAIIERAGLTATGLTEMVSPSSELSSRTGTRLYMAPELVAGRAPSIKSDLYSLGVLFYQMIVGDLSRPVATDWEQHVEDSLLREDLHGCLAGDPSDRFAGAEELATRLRNLENRRAERDKQIAAKHAHARRRRVAIAFVCAAGLFAVLAAALGYGLRREHIAHEATAQELYYATIGLIEKCIGESRYQKARELLASCPERFRHWEWGRLQYLCNVDWATLKGQTDSIRAVAFSPDGAHLATASLDGTIILWNVETGAREQTLEKPPAGVCSISFGPNGRHLAAGYSDGMTVIWDVTTQERAATFQGDNGIMLAAFSPDGEHLAIAPGRIPKSEPVLRDRPIEIRDAKTGGLVSQLPCNRRGIHCIAFSPTSRLLIFDDGSKAKVWDWVASHEVFSSVLIGDRILCMAISPDEKQLAVGGTGDTVHVWDLERRAEQSLLRGHPEWVRSVAFSPDGRYLAVSAGDSTVKIWNPQTGERILTLGGHSDAVESVAFSPDGLRLATGSEDRTAKIWNLREARGTTVLRKHAGPVSSVAVSKDGSILATASWDGTARLWDTKTGLETQSVGGKGVAIASLAMAPDGKRLATGYGEGGGIGIWSLQDGKEVLNFGITTGPVTSLAFSPDGRYLAAAHGVEWGREHGPKHAEVWDPATGEKLMTLRGHEGPLLDLAYSPDGSRLATVGADGMARIWNAQTGEEVGIFRGDAGPLKSVAWRPDGKRIAVGGTDGRGCIFDPQTLQLCAPLHSGRSEIHSAAYSPDGERLATGQGDGAVRIWHGETGREILTLTEHRYPESQIAFSPDGRLLFTAGTWSSDARIRPSFAWTLDDDSAEAGQTDDDWTEKLKSSRRATILKALEVVLPQHRKHIAAERKQIEVCANNLRRIQAALTRYRGDHDDTMPDSLSDLVPGYVSTTTLICPADPERSLGESVSNAKASTSYIYLFSPDPVSGDASSSLTIRQLNLNDRRQYGEITPLVRCLHHGRRLNLSHGGKLYFSTTQWKDSDGREDFPATGGLPGETEFGAFTSRFGR